MAATRAASNMANSAQPSFSLPHTRQNLGASTSAGGERATDLNQLNDPATLAGVDLNAEAETLRLASKEAQAKLIHLGRQRVLVNEKVLQAAVIKIAANYGLKFLEPDTLPFLALALQSRLRALIEGMVAARDHRASTTFLRPPPNYDGDFEQTGEWAPMWDEVMHDDVGKVLTTYDTIERAEERKERIARTARDTAEKEEQAAKEAAEAAAAAAIVEVEPTTKKAKKASQKQTITEQQSYELSQRTAMAQLGGPKLPAWAMGGGAAGSSSLSKNKSPSFGLDSATAAPSALPPDPTSSLVPLSASIERNRIPPATLDSPVNWADALFALERERGGGSLAGGAKALHTAQIKRGQKRLLDM